MQVLPSSEKLAFSREMQQAALGYMLHKPAFCAKCVLFFKSEYFADDILGSIFNAICGYYNEFKTTPSPEALSDYIKIRLKYTRDYRSAIFDCDMFKSKYPFDLISNSISDWCRTGLFKSHVELGMKYFQKQEADKFTDLMRTFLDKASEMNFSADIAYQIGDFQKDITETMNQTQSDLTTGIKEFDDALGGGLVRGEHTVLLAPLSIGKTTTTLNFIAHNIYRGKDCLLITHEGRPTDIMNKLRQRMVMGTRQDFFDAVSNKNDLMLQKLHFAEEKLKKHLVYVPFNKAGSLFIEDVIEIIRQKNQQLFAERGKFFDLIADDYPGKLLSRDMKNYKEMRHAAKYCYDQLQQTALEYNCHAISPVQANREGLKMNRNREGEDFLDATVINESLGIAQDASNIISLNRSLEDARKNIMHFHIAKTRQGPSDITVQANTDFSRAITHDASLGVVILDKANLYQQKLETIQKIRDNYGKNQ